MVFVRWVDYFNKGLKLILGLLFVAMTLSFFFNIAVRFVFTALDIHISVPWTQELATYIMIWSVFLGIAVAVRNDKLISMELFVHTLPAKLGKILKVGALLLTVVFFFYLIFIGYDLAFNQGSRQTSPVMGISMTIIYISMFIGSIIAIVNIFTLFLETYLTKKDIRFVASDEESVD
ncbi:TRAP transporter small permease [Salicibibacter cibi]|uniref:TRAP transporter small permease n=1 Tax=Salicibibacter cibi TaxID=2743001 RepID=A0A7T7CEA8_9BACI|nr:TRAP transporter small permease [Salicibibacter cibi]QQK78859.1 TRAP transporter small permease [Salicibibacter cibi]